MPFFKVKFKRYHFPKTTFGEDLNEILRFSGADYAIYFVVSAFLFLPNVWLCGNYNAALWRDFSDFAEASSDLWKRYFDVNVMGVFYCTKAVLNGMLQNGYGRIVNVASVAGVYGNAKMTHYSATKGAVIAMTRALAKEVTEKGVLVNCVSPGSVSPSQNENIDFYQPTELSFIGRTGTDRENANLICFLASDEASYISGQNIQIDGCRKKL